MARNRVSPKSSRVSACLESYLLAYLRMSIVLSCNAMRPKAHQAPVNIRIYTPRSLGRNHHFPLRMACFAARVFLPLAPRTPCKLSNFFFAYRFASASSTSSSTKVLLRLARVRLSALAVPNGVVEGMTVPI